MHDLVIDNARIIDGLGAPARDGGVAVSGRPHRGDRRRPGRGAGERVDAQGLVLAPGIVDIHTHYDAQLTWDPFATPSTSLGVTTVVIGNCGFTIAPCRPQHRDVIMRNLTHVEGMSLEAHARGHQLGLRELSRSTSPRIERRGMVPNVASFVGHSSVRTYVLGRGREQARRRPTPRSPRCGGSCWRRVRGRRHRLRHLHARAAQRRERHPDALAAGGRARDARAHGRARRGRARRLHADQGHDLHHSLAREDRGARTAGP